MRIMLDWTLEDFQYMVGFWGDAEKVYRSLTAREHAFVENLLENLEELKNPEDEYFVSCTEVNDFMASDVPKILVENGFRDKDGNIIEEESNEITNGH